MIIIIFKSMTLMRDKLQLYAYQFDIHLYTCSLQVIELHNNVLHYLVTIVLELAWVGTSVLQFHAYFRSSASQQFLRIHAVIVLRQCATVYFVVHRKLQLIKWATDKLIRVVMYFR